MASVNLTAEEDARGRVREIKSTLGIDLTPHQMPDLAPTSPGRGPPS